MLGFQFTFCGENVGLIGLVVQAALDDSERWPEK